MDSLLLSKDLRYFPKIAQVEIERKADVRGKRQHNYNRIFERNSLPESIN